MHCQVQSSYPIIPRQPVDMLGNLINTGDYVCFAVRQSSTCRLELGYVYAIDGERLSLVKKTPYHKEPIKGHTGKLDRLVVIDRDSVPLALRQQLEEFPHAH